MHAPPPAATGAFDPRPLAARLVRAAQQGLASAVLADACPEGVALRTPRGEVSFARLHERANRAARALQALGVGPGDGVALMSRNRSEFVEVLLGALRIGARLTPMATALQSEEAAYIVRDCGARVFVVEPELAGAGAGAKAGAAHELLLGAPYEEALAAQSAADPAHPQAGQLMLYTSGTTGRPKGVCHPGPDVQGPQFAGSFFDYQPGDVHLCAGPAYHAAPLLFDLRWPLASGTPVVLLPRWEAHATLEAMARHRVTHTHCVPAMFQRWLALPSEERARFDLSALRLVAHGAAPCPVPVKRAMIAWLGPVLLEYYGATEGGEGIHISSADWLAHPGAVGRLSEVNGHVLLDDQHRPVPPGEVGTLWLRAPSGGRFRYHGAAAPAAAASGSEGGGAADAPEGFFTLGDRGRVDAEGWLTLTGRRADLIISGGVNIDPAEVDEVLMRHPAVAQACTVGAPDERFGEKVVSVVVLKRPHEAHPAVAEPPALKEALLAHAAALLAAFKRPRDIHFSESLPFSENGKLLRRRVRERFWHGLGREL